jgi:hypothetical protein
MGLLIRTGDDEDNNNNNNNNNNNCSISIAPNL